MKLPEDKNERNKILMLVAMGVAGVLYAVFQLGLAPLMESKKSAERQIEKLQQQIKEANAKIQKTDRDRKANVAALTEIKDISDKYVLRHRLGNYLLGAQEIIERHAKAAGVELESVREAGLSDVPRVNRTDPVVLRTYTAKVTILCSYSKLVDFLKEVESGNPCLTLAGLQITSRPEDVRKHLVILDIQWPIWIDDGLPAEIDRQLSAAIAEDQNETAAPTEKPPADGKRKKKEGGT